LTLKYKEVKFTHKLLEQEGHPSGTIGDKQRISMVFRDWFFWVYGVCEEPNGKALWTA